MKTFRVLIVKFSSIKLLQKFYKYEFILIDKQNTNKFNFGFAVDLMIKDLKIAIKESEKSGNNYFLTKNVLNKYKKLSKQGNGRLDTSCLIKAISK